MARTVRPSSIGFLLVLVCLAGCDRTSTQDQAPGRILVAAAASLRDLLAATQPAFEAAHKQTRLEFTFGASSTLARQIHEGAPADVFLSADAATVERIRSDLDPASIRAFLGNRLALVVRAGIASRPASPRDLVGQPGMLALAGPDVPAGRYARAWLEQAGLLAALLPRIANADDVRAALALVDSGAADWAIVYETDARAAKTATLAWTAPDADDPGIAYVAATAARSKAPGARAYLDWIASDAFQSAAARLGFRRPP